MQVHRNSEDLLHFDKAVLTIGTFDGVHTGHQQVIDQLKKTATEIGGESVIITFDPHPRTVVKANSGIRMINTTNEKIELLSKKGIDQLVIVPFTEAFSALTAEKYITDFLVKKFHPHTIVIGYDHHFGKGRTGNFALLEQYALRCNYVLREIPAHILDSISVSSTRIRNAISHGEMDIANALLGYSFFFEGKVMEGNKTGRTIGYPTANLEPAEKDKLLPADGVYAVDVVWDQQLFKGMMNIGFRPTVGGTKRTIEVNIFDFDKTIYGETLRINVKKKLREEQKFDGLPALKAQLALDKLQALE